MAQDLATISSEGDLEVVVLLETHSLLADLIGPDYYKVGGTAPEQSVQFASGVCFDYFLVRVQELTASGSGNVLIDGKPVSLSLVEGLERLCARHGAEAQQSGLTGCLAKLKEWLEEEEAVKFWCSEVNMHVVLNIPRQQMISIAANATKHHLLRLSVQLKKLNGWCQKAGYNILPQQLIEVHKSLMTELRHALQYYATRLLELLGGVFLALNRLVVARYAANPTNDVSKMIFPAGVTSDVFENLYGEVLVFHNYTDERIVKFTPVAASFCCNSYWANK